MLTLLPTPVYRQDERKSRELDVSSLAPLCVHALVTEDEARPGGDTGVLVPMPPRVRPWNSQVCCSLFNVGGLRELHASARWVIEIYPPSGECDYPEFEVTVYHTGWAQALTLQAFGPPKDHEERIGREYAARLLHQVLSASYQARP